MMKCHALQFFFHCHAGGNKMEDTKVKIIDKFLVRTYIYSIFPTTDLVSIVDEICKNPLYSGSIHTKHYMRKVPTPLHNILIKDPVQNLEYNNLDNLIGVRYSCTMSVYGLFNIVIPLYGIKYHSLKNNYDYLFNRSKTRRFATLTKMNTLLKITYPTITIEQMDKTGWYCEYEIFALSDESMKGIFQ